MHVHAYGTLGFGDPDSIGIHQGVTSMVDAGGPGIGTLDEFEALFLGHTATSLYAGPHIHPIGIVGLNFIQDEVRSFKNISIEKWLDWTESHPGLVRYLKVGAYGPLGTMPLYVAKGVSDMIRVPLYLHIGEYLIKDNHPSTNETAFNLCQSGDIVTHLYHNNLGRVLDDEGRVLPFVRDAEKRGVLFDIGFGAYSFSWDVAEKAYAQDLVPHFISSDLQQFNVCGPVFSLANVMSIFLRLGMSLGEVIERVTANPARALALTDRAGSLRVGLPADITVFRVEAGEFDLADCHTQKRKADRKIVPIMAFKDGQRFDTDLALAQDERKWFMQVAEEEVPPAAASLSRRQVEFLAALARGLVDVHWGPYTAERLDLDKAYELQDVFHQVRRAQGLPLRDALTAVFDCFLVNPFSMQLGLFLARLERPFALQRLNDVVSRQFMAAP
jgi:dihydroorotase